MADAGAAALMASWLLADPSVASAPGLALPVLPNWVLLAAGAAAVVGVLTALATWLLLRRSSSPVKRPPIGPVVPLVLPAKPAPTQPGEPGVPNPFATLPETHLVVVRGFPVEARYYRISTSPFRVGADPSNHLVIEAPHVSGLHATFELEADGSVIVIDASRNGTYVDGTRVANGQRIPLANGQRIAFSRDVEVRLEQSMGVAEPPRRDVAIGASAPGPSPARKAATVLGPSKPWSDKR